MDEERSGAEGERGMRVRLYKQENGVDFECEIEVSASYHPEVLESMCRQAAVTIGGIYPEDELKEHLDEMFGDGAE